MILLRPALAACLVHLRMRVVSPLFWFGIVLQPAIFASIGIVLFGAGHGGHLAYAALGGGLVGLWAATLADASFDIQQERGQGTLEQLLGSPTPLPVVVAGKVLASVLPGLASFVVSIGGTLAVLGSWPAVDAAPFAVSFALTLGGFYSLGLVLAPLFTLVRLMPGLLNALEVPLYLLCGFMFPVAQLPPWTAPLSSLLAPRWTILALYGAAGEVRGVPYAACWALGLLLIAANLGLAWALFRRLERRCRITGDLMTV